jgi:hypothetical protein
MHDGLAADPAGASRNMHLRFLLDGNADVARHRAYHSVDQAFEDREPG